MTVRPAPRAGALRKRDAVTALVPRGVMTRAALAGAVAVRPAVFCRPALRVVFCCVTAREFTFDFDRVTVRDRVTARVVVFGVEVTRDGVRR